MLGGLRGQVLGGGVLGGPGGRVLGGGVLGGPGGRVLGCRIWGGGLDNWTERVLLRGDRDAA